ncbi:MAG: hypothetical protein IPJ30_01330 [Acidobacteria bacterium]|nr:hypothetical protein [Acidobacteriota bacterium]
MKKFFYTLAFVIVALAFVPVAASAQGNGKIKGKLTYPSEFIPADMVVCVEGTTRTVCSNSRDKAGYVFKVNRGREIRDIAAGGQVLHLWENPRNGR